MTTSPTGSRTRTVKTPALSREGETEQRRNQTPTVKMPAQARRKTGQTEKLQKLDPPPPLPRPLPSATPAGGSYMVVKKSGRAQTENGEVAARRVKVATLGSGVVVDIGEHEISMTRREASSLLEQLYAALK